MTAVPAGDGLCGDCRGCGCAVNDYRAHVYGERKCCPDCDHRPLPALRDVLAAAARDAEKVRRVEVLADFLDRCAEDTDRPNCIVAANVTPDRLALLGRVYRDDAARIRRALDGTT